MPFDSSWELKNEEVLYHVKALDSNRASGYDTLGNDLLKHVIDIILPFVEHLFEACLRLHYEPDIFKDTLTTPQLKDIKKDPTDPKSYRPIALLSALGKVLESIMKSRIVDFIAKNDILAKNQFGGPGKSTIQALDRLLDQVYSGWTRKQAWQSSLFTLDVVGAYPHVRHDKLLQILADLGFPPWICQFVHSFLSNRREYIKMRGHRVQGPYRTFIGIPQGSPLSPILFLLFTSPLLRDFERKSLDPSSDRTLLAYHDDMHILISSRTLKENCRIIEELHNEIMQWASEKRMSFNKYGIRHFWRPGGKEPKDRDCIPNIPGLTNEKMNEPLRILGLEVDPRLQWHSQVAAVSSATTINVLY